MFARFARSILLALVLTFAAVASDGASLRAQTDGPSLYARMGGYDVVAGMVDDFFGRFAGDASLAQFLGGLNTPAQMRVRQNFIDFFCQRAGGPCLYNGREMSAAHDGLGISSANFDSVARHFRDAIAGSGIPARERDELMAIIMGLRGEIVTE